MRRSVTIVVALGLAAIASTAAVAEARVVPPDGMVKGKAQARWHAIWWKATLAKAPGDHECETVRGVRMVFGTALGPRTVFECSMAAGTALYLNGPSTECSTIEKPPFHGDTPQELKACARREHEKFFGRLRVVIDGKRVERTHRWKTATRAFRFRMPKKNVLGTKKRRGKAAAYGSGFFIKGLKPGLHVIKQRATAGKDTAVLIHRVTVT